MAEKEMYEFWQDHIKVHNLDWTVDKAKKVLEAWQRKFTEVFLILLFAFIAHVLDY